MPRLALSLAIHNHQPVGNFDHVVAEATERAYAPMIAALERHPRIRLALHYSGSLLDWLKIHRPDLLQRIRALVTRGQVEIAIPRPLRCAPWAARGLNPWRRDNRTSTNHTACDAVHGDVERAGRTTSATGASSTCARLTIR